MGGMGSPPNASSAPTPAARDLLARLDRIPCWPYPRRILGILGAGIFFAFFDIVTIAAALPVLVDQLHISADQAGRAVTASLFGYIVGSLLVSRLADRVGRRTGLLVSVALFSGGSLMTATSQALWHVVLWRFVSGMGIGADIAGLTTYLAEVSPKALRGRYTAVAIGLGFLGIAVVPFAAELLVPRFEWGWRALFVLGAVGGLVIAFGRRGLAPSARWLLARGRSRDALTAVEEAERYAVGERGVTLPPPEPTDIPSAPISVRGLLASSLRRRLFAFLAIWALYYVGNYAWISLMPELYVKHGLELRSSLWLTAVTSLGFVVGSLTAVHFAERAERKWICAVVAAGWSLLLLAVGWMGSLPVVVAAGFFASASIALFIPLMYTYTGENFPTPTRATCVAMTDGLGHIGGMFCAPIVLGAYDLFHTWGLGFQGALSTMAITGLAASAILTAGPRTRGRSV